MDVSTHSTLPTSLDSYYELEEASGSRVDSHGSNNLTDNNTVTNETGKQGNAATFVTGNSEFLSSTAIDLSGTTDKSIAFWVKIGTAPSSGTTYALFTDYQNVGNKRAWAVMYRNNGGTLEFYTITSNDGSSTSTGTISQTLTAGTWYHVAFLYDKSAGSIEVYVNGSSIGSITGQKTTIYNGSDPFRVGALGDGGSTVWFFDGAIDEMGVWSKLLTSSEITDLYNSGSGIPYVGGTTVSPSVQTLTFSLPAETVSGQASVSVTTQSATFSLPAETVTADWTISPSVQVATFSIPSYIVSAGGIVLAPDAQTATFSLPAEQIVAGATLSPDAQVLTFSLPAESVTADWTVAVDPQVLTVSVPTLEFVGALWARASRNAGDWTRGARNDDG